MYHLIIRRGAEKHFSKLPRKLQQKMAGGLGKLEKDPFRTDLDIKKLVGTRKSYRLRVGELRAIYQLDTKTREISVEDIDFRRTTTY